MRYEWRCAFRSARHEIPEHPPLSVSVGAAVYPRAGYTREELLAAADRALYEMKRRRTETLVEAEHGRVD